MNLINKILLENDDLFQPRRIPEREVERKRKMYEEMDKLGKEKFENIYCLKTEDEQTGNFKYCYFFRHIQNKDRAIRRLIKFNIMSKFEKPLEFFKLLDDNKTLEDFLYVLLGINPLFSNLGNSIDFLNGEKDYTWIQY